MDLLRFLTAGNVDDGKSTLIGRLLYDSKAVSTDILQAIEKASKGKNNGTEIDLSLLTDGLRAEREQGITIDVAYKYFTTQKRKFIIADTPGHIQYTRNMVTGASNSDLAIILIDARNGITDQTRRHSIISSLFGIQHLTVCVNKIDMVNYSEKVFHDIVSAYEKFSEKLSVKEINYIPISAKFGDNVVKPSDKMPWYREKTLLEHLETVEISNDINFSCARFPVQYIIRPQEDNYHDYRGYAGKIVSGIFRKGEQVIILPQQLTSTIKEIEIAGKQVEEAFAPQSVVVHLVDDIDISRGDMITKKDSEIKVTQDIEATICWMNERPLIQGAKLLARHHGKLVKAAVREILYKLDISSFTPVPNDKTINLNDIGRIQLRLASPVAIDNFISNRANGVFVLIDENTNETVGGCIVN